MVWSIKQLYQPGTGPADQVEQYRITSSASVAHVERGKISGYTENLDQLRDLEWSFNISEVPEAGKRKVVSQTVLNANVIEGDAFDLISDLGYQFEYEYWTRSYEYVFGDVVLKLYRLSIKDDGNHVSSADQAMEIDGTEDLLANSYKPLKLLDKSGRWAVKAYVDVRQLTDPEMISATTQLEKFQADISTLFELTTPDRNSFDTRIRRR